ncbi:hypothetical protein H1235_02505 [Pseudoxanthomonas sp. NC8]|nr:hypothetical protein H1235_02505 [Pseudoxanthomonas sp. NC8]
MNMLNLALPLALLVMVAGCSRQQVVAPPTQAELAAATEAVLAGNGFACVPSGGKTVCGCRVGAPIDDIATCDGLSNLCKKMGSKYTCIDGPNGKTCGCSYVLSQG